MKKAFLKLMGCSLLAVMASCGNSETKEETATIDTTVQASDAQVEQTKLAGSRIICAECTEDSLCTQQCLDSVLGCHYIDGTVFEQMTTGSGYTGGGFSPKTVAQIRKIVNTYDCRDHRILVVGNDADKAHDTDIKFKVIKIDRADSLITSVSYTFPLFKKIILQHNPSNISFFKGAKNGEGDIVIRVTTASGELMHYDISDVPPTKYDEVDISKLK
ncbi:hypothetical protein [Polluticoccus soli]|uniref:hypothetical protein n=1 Tax=Polluticoccus soli TaxID=3034150 RepID=UPI0023E0F491|nr:hypothetical protein [Flavipsychrobacter sp. JY13-12]